MENFFGWLTENHSDDFLYYLLIEDIYDWERVPKMMLIGYMVEYCSINGKLAGILECNNTVDALFEELKDAIS